VANAETALTTNIIAITNATVKIEVMYTILHLLSSLGVSCFSCEPYEGRRPAVMRQRPELAGKNIPIRPNDLKSLRLLQGLSLPLVIVAGRRYQYTSSTPVQGNTGKFA